MFTATGVGNTIQSQGTQSRTGSIPWLHNSFYSLGIKWDTVSTPICDQPCLQGNMGQLSGFSTVTLILLHLYLCSQWQILPMFPLTCSAIDPSRLSWCEFLSFWDVNIKKTPKKPKQFVLEVQRRYLFPEIMSRLLKIVVTHFCEQIHQELFFFQYHCAEGNMHRLTNQHYSLAMEDAINAL